MIVKSDSSNSPAMNLYRHQLVGFENVIQLVMHFHNPNVNFYSVNSPTRLKAANPIGLLRVGNCPLPSADSAVKLKRSKA
jgi:hypothetical protein